MLEKHGLFRGTEEFKLDIPAIKNPTPEEIRRTSHWVKSINRDISPAGAVIFKIANVLRWDGEQIDEIEYRLRLAKIPHPLLAWQHGLWLTENQDSSPEFRAMLEKVVHIDFPALVVADWSCKEVSPYVGINDANKRCSMSWPNSNFSEGKQKLGYVAVAANFVKIEHNKK